MRRGVASRRMSVPDEARDVFIHFTPLTAATTARPQAQWKLHVGLDPMGYEPDRDRAIRTALRLGRRYGRPVWIMDRTGGELAPVTEEDVRLGFSATCGRGHETRHVMTVGAIRRATDPLELFCSACMETFTVDATVRQNLQEYAETEAGG